MSNPVGRPQKYTPKILEKANTAREILEKAHSEATRNRDKLEQIIYGVRCYQGLGHKLIAKGHYLDSKYPREKAKSEMQKAVKIYEELRNDFKRLWLEENHDNSGYRELVSRFDKTILPFKQKIDQN
mgnify:CR=1 FL=1